MNDNTSEPWLSAIAAEESVCACRLHFSVTPGLMHDQLTRIITASGIQAI